MTKVNLNLTIVMMPQIYAAYLADDLSPSFTAVLRSTFMLPFRVPVFRQTNFTR
jgi:hypothetical protein